MRKVKLYIAMSLNGKIAREDGDVSWLDSIPNPSECDYGYDEFVKSVDITIQGYSTYKQIVDWGIEFPYRGKENFVITSKPLADNDDVTFISKDCEGLISKLKKENGQDIWLIGGSMTNALFLEMGLVDEVSIFIMPIILQDGIDLFATLSENYQVDHLSTEKYSNNVLRVNYEVVR